MTASDVWNGLLSLAEKSLLHALEGPHGEPRFGMLETVREFALDALRRSGEETLVRRRHGAWYLTLSEQAEPELFGPQQAQWLARLAADHDNLRAALTWAAAQQDGTVVRMASALIRFWRFRCHPNEGLGWLERALAQADDAPLALRARVLLGAGIMASMRADYLRAAALHTQALHVYQQVNDDWGIANAQFHLGDALQGQGNDDAAGALFEESLALFRVLGDVAQMIMPLKDLGRLARRRGDLARAQLLLEETLAICRAHAFGWGMAEALLYLGEVAHDLGDRPRAAQLFVEGLGYYQEHGDTLGIGCCLQALGRLAAADGRPQQAVKLIAVAAALRDTFGFATEPAATAADRRALTTTRTALGPVAFAEAWEAGRRMPLDQAASEAAAIAMTMAEDTFLIVSPPPLRTLTPRGREVLRLIAAGRSNVEIARALFIGRRTVSTHVSHILAKLDLDSRAAAAAYAVRHGVA